MNQLKLIVAEKPSVAQEIAKVLRVTGRKDGYMESGEWLISWCVGHLVGLAQPHEYDKRYAKWNIADLPLFPKQWKYTVAEDKTKQFIILSNLMNDKRIHEIICATDAGREGELIFRLVYTQSDCTKPFKRLWISSMEESAIKEGLENLKASADYDSLYDSAVCRAKADWLVGMNLSRLFSMTYHTGLTIGRVQTPTLALIADREAQILTFKKKLTYSSAIRCGGIEADSEAFSDKKEAEKIVAACHGQAATVISIQKDAKTINPPKLYDLTTLQRDANRIYKFTAQQTLQYTQALYEKKYVTYPRTDSQFLTDDMEETAKLVIATLPSRLNFAKDLQIVPNIGNVLNNEKVSDHHAIIPTQSLVNADLSTLPDGERKILDLIGWRLLCAVSSPHKVESIKAILSCGGYEYVTKGRTVIEDGWKAIEKLLKQKDKAQDKDLPTLSEKQVLDNVESFLLEHESSPPKRFTEDTLLSAMERAGNDDYDTDTEKKGLGTPATRAGIIESIINRGYVERDKNKLIPTKKGMNLIAVVPDVVKSPSLTADWEQTLQRIERGEYSPKIFIENISAMISELVTTYSQVKQDPTLFPSEHEAIGACPRCGGNVVELKQGYACDNRECKFIIWRKNHFFEARGKKLTKGIAVDLLTNGRALVKGLQNKDKSKVYDAYVLLKDTGQYVNFELEFLTKK